MTATDTRPTPGTRLSGYSSAIILVSGVVLVPAALGIIFNSWSAPDAVAYVRMAFAQVAGATVAIITVLAVVLHHMIRRSSAREISWFAGIAIVVTAWQISQVSRASDFLLNGLGQTGL